MATYIKLDTDNQTILSVVMVTDDIDYANMVSGFQLVPSAVSEADTITTTTHYVDTNGDVVRYSDELSAARSSPVEVDYYQWDVNTGWVDHRTAGEARNDKIADQLDEIIALLAATDWTQLPDTAPATTAAYLTYRNALRALPSDPLWPDVTFPTDPNIGRLD